MGYALADHVRRRNSPPSQNHSRTQGRCLNHERVSGSTVREGALARRRVAQFEAEASRRKAAHEEEMERLGSFADSARREMVGFLNEALGRLAATDVDDASGRRSSRRGSDHRSTLAGDRAGVAGYSVLGRLHAIDYMTGLREAALADGKSMTVIKGSLT